MHAFLGVSSIGSIGLTSESTCLGFSFDYPNNKLKTTVDVKRMNAVHHC